MRLRRQVLGVVVALAASLSACSSVDETSFTAEERADFLADSVHAPRRFVYTRTSGASRYEVSGEVEDDYRYRGSVGTVYEEVVVDDQRFVKLSDAAVLPAATRAMANLAPLVGGEWVSDAARAPGEFAPRSSALLSPTALLDAVRALDVGDNAELFKRAVRSSKRYDPDSSGYLRRTDKFAAHPEAGVRYDYFPSPYQPDVVFRDGVPADLDERLRSAFLYVSFWFRGGRVTRIETLFDVDAERVARDARSALDVLSEASGTRSDPATLPPAPAPYREAYEFEYPPEPPVVVRPEHAQTLNLPAE